MHKCEMVDFNYVNNPAIDLCGDGWRLSTTKGVIHATAMINGVLAPPSISEVNSSMIQNLLKEGIIRQFRDLGAITAPDGMLPDSPVPIALIGRLAKGKILGADSILECFSAETDLWAESVFNRLNNKR